MTGRHVQTKLDLASFGGLVVGVGGILGGLVMEGGKVTDIAQVTGAIIVLCGTLGAVLITTPPAAVIRALKLLKWVLLEPRYVMDAIIVEVLSFSNQARRDGLVSLEGALERASDPFVRKALTLAVDGTDPDTLREAMELDMTLEVQRIKAGARVYESAGGYSPTIGIIGAVLGLIQVMKHLQEIEKVGSGIAVAFVATIYGVALANLFLLPAAAKIRNRADELLNVRSMMLEGVCQIVKGSHPKMIEQRLAIYASSGSNTMTYTGGRPAYSQERAA